MKRLMIATAATSIAALAAAPALAGNITPPAPDPVIAAPAPAPAAPVSYDWTGAYGGVQLGWGMLNADGGGLDEDGDGVIGGITAGYDWDLGNYVVGVGLDYNAANIETDPGNATLDALGRARVRAGFDTGNWLIYGTGGAAYADASIVGTGAESDWGWFAGAGAEYRVNQNLSVAGEALYHRFDDFDSTGVDLDTTTLQARVLYRF